MRNRGCWHGTTARGLLAQQRPIRRAKRPLRLAHTLPASLKIFGLKVGRTLRVSRGSVGRCRVSLALGHALPAESCFNRPIFKGRWCHSDS